MGVTREKRSLSLGRARSDVWSLQCGWPLGTLMRRDVVKRKCDQRLHRPQRVPYAFGANVELLRMFVVTYFRLPEELPACCVHVVGCGCSLGVESDASDVGSISLKCR